ncbi:jg3335 [Pararge aegeria aegeria]|uniref:Jg3335 protein n=1 Tax=Pararge aegeria aegeria TaxID=348720 RepID=A0A8S4S069_9NEOP|nr:jg3335 [Pararge aegeria aegeria]
MPGHANSPYWAAVDFDSEGEEEKNPPPSNRVYLDPWDNDAFGMLQGESPDSSTEQINSFAGEPVSASFYYVPTKTYDSGEEPKPNKRTLFPEDMVTPDYSVYGRRPSRHVMPEYSDRDMPIYGHRPIPERRRSMYIEEPVYVPVPHPMVYESLYGPVPMPNPYMHPPRPRMSLQHQPEYVMGNGYGKQRRHSRLTEAYEQYAYETLSPQYEDWARPMPKTAPDNFHLSRYGHLQIDYSCSWNSLDRIIRNQ